MHVKVTEHCGVNSKSTGLPQDEEEEEEDEHREQFSLPSDAWQLSYTTFCCTKTCLKLPNSWNRQNRRFREIDCRFREISCRFHEFDNFNQAFHNFGNSLPNSRSRQAIADFTNSANRLPISRIRQLPDFVTTYIILTQLKIFSPTPSSFTW